jgi:hypothetical protein
MGRSFANQAPNKESHLIHLTQELPGSALRVADATILKKFGDVPDNLDEL